MFTFLHGITAICLTQAFSEMSLRLKTINVPFRLLSKGIDVYTYTVRCYIYLTVFLYIEVKYLEDDMLVKSSKGVSIVQGEKVFTFIHGITVICMSQAFSETKITFLCHFVFCQRPWCIHCQKLYIDLTVLHREVMYLEDDMLVQCTRGETKTQRL